MKPNFLPASSTFSSLKRRGFLKSCASCAGVWSALPLFPLISNSVQSNMLIPQVKTKIGLVFTHQSPDIATWPSQGYDYESRKQQITSKLKQECDDVDFVPVTIQSKDEVESVLSKMGQVDSYMVVMVGIWTGAPVLIAGTGKPTIMVDDLFAGSGEFLVQYSAAKAKKYKVAAVSSSDFQDVVKAVHLLTSIKKLQHSKILDVTDSELKGWSNPLTLKEFFGVELQQVRSDEMEESYQNADIAAARSWAKAWMEGAEKVIEPSKEEIERSGRIYLGMKDILNKHNAQAIAVDCLGLFYGSKLSAYPCLGFCQLNNDGGVGACEGDIESTVTMLAMNYLIKQPGYISDPVIDTSKNQIIYAHCVAPTKVFGSDQPSNPYHIRSHAEDGKGAAMRSLMPLGEITTTLKFSLQRPQVVMHQAVTVENVDEPKACRTKLAAEVKGDIDSLMNHWNEWGWHRVTFYGDHKKTVEDFSALMGIEVVHEA